MTDKKRIVIEYSNKSLENAVEIVAYIRLRFSEKEIINFFNALHNFEKIISSFPTLYPQSAKKELRRAVLSRVLSVYYSFKNDKIRIVSIIDNRRDLKEKIK